MCDVVDQTGGPGSLTEKVSSGYEAIFLKTARH